MGVFIADAESKNVETDQIANNSVQQNEKYSNVSISHENGFMATNKANTQRVLMNADDCFVVQVKQNGEWATVNTLEGFGLLVDRITNTAAKEKFYVTVGKLDSESYGFQLHRINSKNEDIVVAEIGQLDGLSNLFIQSKYPITLKSRENNAISVIDTEGNYKVLNSSAYTGELYLKTKDDRVVRLNINNGEISDAIIT
jgi:hypothetical protein